MMKSFYRKIVKVDEEWMYGDKVGRRRKIDVITLECTHQYWREKLVSPDDIVSTKICEACFKVWCDNRGRWGRRVYKTWDKIARKIMEAQL